MTQFHGASIYASRLDLEVPGFEADALFKNTLVEATVRDGVVRVLATSLSDAQESRARDLARDVSARAVIFRQD